MEKPDYDFWEKQPRYTLSEAAYLCCDIEPEPEPEQEQEQLPRDIPQKVRAMAARLLREVSFWVTGYSHFRIVRILPPQDPDVDSDLSKLWRKNTPGKRLFKREDLRSWAMETGQRDLMPFLFPEDREQSNTDDARMRADTEEALSAFETLNPGLVKPVNESDATLGAAIREQRREFANRNQERSHARQAEWERWRAKAAEIQAGRTREASKRELAELVKAALNLKDNIETIRKKL